MLRSVVDLAKEKKLGVRGVVERGIERDIDFYIRVKEGSVYSYIKNFLNPVMLGHSNIAGLKRDDRIIYTPVKLNNVVALRLSRDVLNNWQKGLLASQSVFLSALRLNGSLENIYCIERDFLPGKYEFFYFGCLSSTVMQEISCGGVSLEEGCTDIRGARRFETKLREWGRVEFIRGPFCFLVGRYRLIMNLIEQDLYASRSRSVISYQMSVFEKGEAFQERDGFVNVCDPDSLIVDDQDIFILERSVVELFGRKEKRDEGMVGNVENFSSSGAAEAYREDAIKWISKETGVDKHHIAHAEKMIDFAAIAICAWGKNVAKGKADTGYCRQLIGLLPEECQRYSENLVRMVVLRFKSEKGGGLPRAVSLIKRGEGEEIWNKTILPVIFKAWEKYVFQRSKTAKKEIRRDWTGDLKVFLERNYVKNDYVDAVLSILISDQDAENLFQ